MSSLRSNRPFLRLFAAGTASLVGDWLGYVAIHVLAVSADAGPLDLAFVLAAHALPAAIASPFAGAIVDRFDRRSVLVAADAIATILTIGMAIAASQRRLDLLEALLIVRSATTALVPPAESAAVRRLVPDADLDAANATLAASWSTTYVLGMALGGLVATFGTELALLVDAASFALGAALHGSLPAMPVGYAPRGAGLLRVLADTPRETRTAWRHAFAAPDLLRAILGKAPNALASGAAWIALTALVVERRDAGSVALALGLLQAARGAGTAVGPWVVARLRHHPRRVASERAANAVTLTAIGLLAITRSPPAALALAFVWGVGTGSNWMTAHTELLRRADDALLGRLAAIDELLVATATVLGTFVAAIAATIGSTSVAFAVAVVVGSAGLLGSAAIVGTSRKRHAGGEHVPNRLALPEGPPYLRPLPAEERCPAKSHPV